MKNERLLENLADWFSSYSKGVIAFSGGVDSMFLLEAASRFFNGDILSVTAAPPYMADSELDDVEKYIRSAGIDHRTVSIPFPEELRNNPEQRCYICKKHLFSPVIREAGEFCADVVMEGSNVDDLDDYRPGMKAVEELDIKSPLLECGFRKSDIRYFSGKWGLIAADKPAYSCLLTRFPHNTEIKAEDLSKVEEAEKFLHSSGITSVRVRSHGDVARIEFDDNNLILLSDPGFRKQVNDGIREAGFRYVAADLAGYCMGNMNKLKDNK